MTTNEMEKKFDEVASTFEEYKSANDARIKEIETKGFESAETKERMAKMDAALDGLKEQIDTLAAASKRKTVLDSKGQELSEFQIQHKEAFGKYARKGDESGFETKEMSVISAEDGGYLVPDEMSNEIVKRLFDTSPIRDLASVQTISSSELEILEDLDQIGSGWVAERAERDVTPTSKLNMLKIPAHEIYAEPLATQKLLDDASINLESWLSEKAADKMARDENSAFVLGDGLGKPKGFLTYADGTGVFGTVQRVKSGVDGAFAAAPNQADRLIEMHATLKQQYRMNAYWAMNRLTVAHVRKFKDNDGQYMWQPSLQADKPALFLGNPIREMDDMVGPSSYAAGSLAIALADFRAAYQIVDRKAITLIRDNITVKGKVLFYFSKRVGGGVKNFDAIKIFELSA